MTTNEEIRINELERRMNKYDEIIENLRDIVIELKARADVNYKWLMAILAIACCVIGALVGYIIH